MEITIIAGVAENGVIGRDGSLPWHYPEDLKHFRETTLGAPIIMGRTTYESIGRPLPKRRNIILSRTLTAAPEGYELFSSLEAALESCTEPEVFIIGGAALYKAALPRATKMIITRIKRAHDGDTHFPEYDTQNWEESAREAHDAFDIVTLRRVHG